MDRQDVGRETVARLDCIECSANGQPRREMNGWAGGWTVQSAALADCVKRGFCLLIVQSHWLNEKEERQAIRIGRRLVFDWVAMWAVTAFGGQTQVCLFCRAAGSASRRTRLPGVAWSV
jgi:hypothetical protein